MASEIAALRDHAEQMERNSQKDKEHQQAMMDSQRALELAELRAQMQQAQKEAEVQQAVLEKRIAEQNTAELQQKMHDREEAEQKLQVCSCLQISKQNCNMSVSRMWMCCCRFEVWLSEQSA